MQQSILRMIAFGSFGIAGNSYLGRVTYAMLFAYHGYLIHATRIQQVNYMDGYGNVTL